MAKKKRKKKKLISRVSYDKTYDKTIGFKSEEKKKEKEKDCHTGFKEIVPNLYVGREKDLETIIKDMNILVPLVPLEPYIWNDGFKGIVYGVPIRDYEILPDDVALHRADSIKDFVENELKVAIFCMGGHGRTGYFASIVLGLIGIEDPIELLRSKYCERVLETSEQIEAVSRILQKPELAKKHKAYSHFKGLSGYYDYNDYEYWYNDNKENKCGNCKYFNPAHRTAYGYTSGYCMITKGWQSSEFEACSEFSPIDNKQITLIE